MTDRRKRTTPAGIPAEPTPPTDMSALEREIARYVSQSRGVDAQAVARCVNRLGQTAALSSAIAMSAAADAAVIYSGLQNISLPGGNAHSFAIDINGDAIDDFIFSIFSTNTSGGYTYAAVNGGNNDNGVLFNGVPFFADRLGFGDIIGAGDQLFIEDGNKDVILRSINSYGVNPVGEWGATSTGFLGVKLNLGNDSYFAWIRVALAEGNGAAPRPPDDIIVLDWAYEDTGAAIIAGITSGNPPPPSPPVTTSPVPLPGSLSLLAMGVAGLAAFRKRRTETAD